MNINSINNRQLYTYNTINNQFSNLRTDKSLKADSISFGNITPEDKMTAYAIKILRDNNLKEDQPVVIKSDIKYLPFVDILTREAYKKNSGLVHVDFVIPEIEALKKKHNITEDFEYKKEQLQEFKDDNALFLTFNNTNNPYKECKINDTEASSELKKFIPEIPNSVRKKFDFRPKEILETSLDIHKGEPAQISGELEHIPFIIDVVDYLYSKNDTKLVDVKINHKTDLNLYKYGKESLLEKVPHSAISEVKEKYEKDTARLWFDGEDPNECADIDSAKMEKRSGALNKARQEYREKMMNNNPWLIYYTPSIALAKEAYPEYKDNPLKALEKAYSEANKINRTGEMAEHLENLQHRADAMNELIDKGYKTLHYVSVDADTKQPDGKTDFKITLSDKSMFNSATLEMKKTGHNPIVNIPTEEVFTSPLCDTAEGKLSATMPFVINGKVVEGAVFNFHKGKIVDLKAKKNEDALRELINTHENADRLGEVALVAGSPIAKSGRIFKSTLLDENASCHLALGDAYADTIKGAIDIEDFEEQQQYLKDEHINTSTTHYDFMVGGDNVYISAINDKTGDVIDIIKNDTFLI